MAYKNLLPPEDIPDLSDLSPLSGVLLVNRVFATGGCADKVAHNLHVTCVRLLDAAVQNYSLGRLAIQEFNARRPETFDFGSILKATTHFEACIWFLERFIKNTRALRSWKDAEPTLKALIPATLSVLRQKNESHITHVRNALAHSELDARKPQQEEGPSALLAVEEGLSVAGQPTISWDQLTSWLTDAHACMTRVAEFKRDTRAAPDGDTDNATT